MEFDKYKAVIFDLDGTIFDKSWLPLRLVMADLFNVPILWAERKARKILKGIDFGNEECFYDALFAKMSEIKNGLTPEKARRWYFDRYMPLQVAALEHYYTPRPFIDVLIQSLRDKGIKTILYSDYGSAKEKLVALNLDPAYFDIIASSQELGGLKPSQASMQRLLSKIVVPASQCLMIGDREDTDGASAASVEMEYRGIDVLTY